MTDRQTIRAVPPLPRGAPDGCYFDQQKADDAVTVCEYFDLPIQDWQRRIITRLVGWRRPDGSALYRTFGRGPLYDAIGGRR